MDKNTSADHSDISYEIDFSAIAKIVYNSKKAILIATTIFATLSVIYALSQPNTYRSTALLKVSDVQGIAAKSTSSSGTLSQLTGSLLSGSQGSEGSNLAISTIQSLGFFTSLILENPTVVKYLIASKKYNTSSRDVEFDKDIYDAKNNTFSVSTSYQELFKYYNQIVFIDQDKITSFISIKVEHISPIFAKEFLDTIINSLNNYARAADIQDAENAIAYLESQYLEYPVSEIQTGISNLMEKQLQKKMLANISQDYLLKVIDAPFEPEKKFKPSRAYICIVGTILGFIISALSIIIRHYIVLRKTLS